MATLTIDKSGNTAANKIQHSNIQWYDGKRRTMYLGGRRYNRKTAERVKEIVETLLYYKWNGIIVPDKATAHWLRTAPDDLKAKLAKAGLLTIETPKTCQMLWDAFLKHKTAEIKQNTIKGYQETRLRFFEVFLLEESIERITAERLLEWRTLLQGEYAEATVAGHIKKVKAVLNWAVEQDWFAKSPARNVPTGSFRNREHDRFITMDEYAKLLDACPNQEWRTIIALARIGGLRCPSELQRLRWSDVDWTQNRFLVHSPKTERHENHATRLVPLFEELRLELERLFAGNADEYVVQSYQGSAWSLNEQFRTIAESTDLGRIVCPFRNMRRSRSNEVVRRWGETKESLWIGHTADVMERHYRQHLDDDFR